MSPASVAAPAVLLALLAACWAPAEAPSGPDPGDGAPLAADTQGFPAPPFTAWTAAAPTTIVGPGGTPLRLLERGGVRVEVLQVLPERVRVSCTGCAEAPVQGWLQSGAIWWPSAPVPVALDHPLRRALELRQAWAEGSLAPPEGVTADALCALVDGGWQGADPPTWQQGEARLLLRFADGRWLPPELHGAPAPAPGACALRLTPGAEHPAPTPPG